MTEFTIEELAIPRRIGDAAWEDFAAGIEARNAAEVRGFGTPEVAYPPEELHIHWLDPHEPKRWWGARVDGRIVARAVLEWSVDVEEPVAWVDVRVHPGHEGRGIGGALAHAVEEAAIGQGFVRMLTYAASAPAEGEQLVPPTGAGSVPRGNREVRFLLDRGWRLEQVTRASRYALPADTADLEARRAAAAARAAAYRVHVWWGPTPERFLEDQAHLYTRMSTEEPTAGLEQPEDHWDVDRVREHDARHADSPRAILTAAAEHLESGRLGAFTSLSVPHDVSRPVTQEDTLVLPEHRGRRLGMLLKVENLLELEHTAPGHPSVLTWNAEENRPMLDVNEAVGFVPIGYEGAWRKDLV